MSATFLTAEWRKLLFANYPIDPKVLLPYVPYRTEIDYFDGVCYASLVGFLFARTRVLGIAVPFHQNFEEVNLRFYVRFKEGTEWKRGVVFIREIVPRFMISFVANTLYGEHYTTHRMRHEWRDDGDTMHIGYHWRVGSNWNALTADTEKQPVPLVNGSAEEFITEHYWGYTQMGASRSGTYEVVHPRWKLYPVRSFNAVIDTTRLYGPAFAPFLASPPASVFVAEGSEVAVRRGQVIV